MQSGPGVLFRLRDSSLNACSSVTPSLKLCVPVTYEAVKRSALRPVRAIGAVRSDVAP